MLKKILIYGIGTFFSKILVFLMIPVYTRFLSPSDYGYYDVLLSNMQLIVAIVFMEVWSGIIRFMFDDDDAYSPIKTFISLSPIFALLYVAVFFALSRFFAIRFPVIAFCYGIAYLLFFVMNSVCRGLGRNVDYVISGAISTTVSCALSFVSLVVLHKGIACLFLSLSAGYICAVLYVELRTRALLVALKKQSSREKRREMLSYCFPLMLNTFSYSFLSLFNKNIIMRQLGESVSGYYAVAEKVAAILSLAISIYLLAWQEEAFAAAKNENRSEIYSYYLNQYIKCIGLLIPVYMLVCYFLFPFISGKTFIVALELIPLFAIQVYISQLSGFLSTIIAVQKQTMEILISTVVGAFFNCILIFFFIPKFGMLSSNISLSISFFICAAIRYIYSNRFIRLRFKFIWPCVVVFEFLLAYMLFKSGKAFFILFALIGFAVIWGLANKEMLKNYTTRFLKK